MLWRGRVTLCQFREMAVKGLNWTRVTVLNLKGFAGHYITKLKYDK